MCNYKTLIILLNWNGSYDTLECCKSLKQVTEVKKEKQMFLLLIIIHLSNSVIILKMD